MSKPKATPLLERRKRFLIASNDSNFKTSSAPSRILSKETKETQSSNSKTHKTTAKTNLFVSLPAISAAALFSQALPLSNVKQNGNTIPQQSKDIEELPEVVTEGWMSIRFTDPDGTTNIESEWIKTYAKLSKKRLLCYRDDSKETLSNACFASFAIINYERLNESELQQIVQQYKLDYTEVEWTMTILKRDSFNSKSQSTPKSNIDTDIESPLLFIKYNDKMTKDHWTKAIGNILLWDIAARIIQNKLRTSQLKLRFFKFVDFAVQKRRSNLRISQQSNVTLHDLIRLHAAVKIQSLFRSYSVRRKWRSLIQLRLSNFQMEKKTDESIELVTFALLEDNSTSFQRLLYKDPSVSSKEKAKRTFMNTLRRIKSTGSQESIMAAASKELVTQSPSSQNLSGNVLASFKENYIRAASIEKTVEIITKEEQKLESFFARIVEYTLLEFCHPNKFLQLLTMRFQQSSQAIQERVIEVVVHWVRHFPRDFNSYRMSDRFKLFVEEVAKTQPDRAAKIQRIFERKVLKKGLFTPSLFSDLRNVDFRLMPMPILLQQDPKTIHDVDTMEMARQLSLISFTLFSQIELRELLNQSWEKKRKEIDSPHLLIFFNRFNELTSWIIQTILEPDDITEIVMIIEKLIVVADHCRNLNNFNDMVIITTSLQHPCISRLTRVWNNVSSKHIKIFDSLQDLMQVERNSKVLRTAMKKAKPPAIPYIGVYTKDLVFLNENPTIVSDNLVNFEKMELIYKILNIIEACRERSYNFMPVTKIQELLLPKTVWDSSSWWTKSRRIEPRV